jgi:hypothetical protein
MPVFETSYDTTASLTKKTSDLERKLQELLIKGNLDKQSLGYEDPTYKLRFLLSLDPNEEEVQKYPHPILIKGLKSEEYIVTDLRPYIRSNATAETLQSSIKNKTMYDLQIGRAILNAQWLRPEQRKSMMLRFRIAAKLYVEVLAHLINRTYVLDFRQLIDLKIALAYFYYSLFYTEEEFRDKKQSVIFHIIQNTGYPEDTVTALVNRAGYYKNISVFCDEVGELCDSARLARFNFAVLLNVANNAWYGEDSAEITAVSLETPFNWISLCYAIISDRGYKATNIYRVAEKNVKAKELDEFMYSYKDIYGNISLESIKEDATGEFFSDSDESESNGKSLEELIESI